VKLRTQIILIGALLLAVMAVSSLKSGSRSAAAGRSGGSCCPALPGMSTLPGSGATNETSGNRDTNASSATNPK
jgi:hypothetical protein